MNDIGPMIVVSYRDAEDGSEEATDDRGILATDRIADDRAGTGTDQRTGKFIRCTSDGAAHGDQTRQ